MALSGCGSPSPFRREGKRWPDDRWTGPAARIGMRPAPTSRVRPTARAPIPTCRGEERRPARSGRQGATLHQAWPSAASRSERRRRSEARPDWPGSESSRSFFCTDRPFDRSWMDIEAEFLLERLRQLARPYRFARGNLRPEELRNFALDLVRAAGTSLPGHESRNAALVEIGLGLVIRRPRDAVLLGHVGHRRLLDRGAAQHLVLHLHDVAWIEEAAFLKLRVADLLGRRIERAVLGERVGLRALAVTSCRHAEPRHKSATNVIVIMPHNGARQDSSGSLSNHKSSIIAPLTVPLRRNLAYISGVIILTHHWHASSPKAARQDGPAP